MVPNAPTLSFSLAFDVFSVGGEVDLTPAVVWWNGLIARNAEARAQDGCSAEDKAAQVNCPECGAQPHKLFWRDGSRWCRKCGARVQ